MEVMMKTLILEGADGAEWALWTPGRSRRNEVALTELPDVDSWPVHHTFAGVSGMRGAAWSGVSVSERTLVLPCQVEGVDTARVVGLFLESVQAGVVGLVAVSEVGVWESSLRFRGVSQVEWWGDRARPVGARFEVELVAPDPGWRGEVVEEVFTPNDLDQGSVVLPLGEGTLPVWPIITITGGTSAHETRFGFNGGGKILLPHRVDGWRINTDPARRSITPATGGAQVLFPGEQPHWPEPPRVEYFPGGGRFFRVDVDPVNPSATHKMTVTYTPERTRPW